MSAQLNALIAQGGTGVMSPLERYNQGQNQAQAQQMNRLSMQNTRQTMDFNQQKMQQAKQDQQLKIIAPFMKSILSLPDHKQKAAYEKAKPMIEQASGQPIPLQFQDWNKEVGTAIMEAGELKLDKPKVSTALTKMNELIAGGMGKEKARGIAYKSIKTMIDPTSGDVVVIDVADPGTPEVLAEGNKLEKELEKKVTDFSKVIEKSGIGELDEVMSNVETMIAEIRKDDENADIPGFGATAGLADMFLTAQGKSLRQRVKTLFNQTLKDRSGAAVTAPELTRLKEEFGQGLIKTDEQLLDALNRFRGIIETHKLTLAAGYGDDVVGTWQDRSGLVLRKIKPKGQGKRYKTNPATGKLELQ